MVYIQIETKYLKIAARILIFWLQVKGVIGLAIEVVYDLVEQGVAKLQSLKVCSVLDSNPGRPESKDSLYNLQKRSLEPKRSKIIF